MSELKRRIGRREAVRIAMLGLLAFLAGCSEGKVVHWGARNRNDPHRKKLLAQLKSGRSYDPPKYPFGAKKRRR
jgi:hypothetical protein